MRYIIALGLSLLPIQSAAGLTAAEQADSFYERGLACEARGELDAADNCYTLTLRANPAHPTARAKLNGLADAFVTRGVAAEKATQLFAAEKSYKQALRMDANHAAAKAHLSELEKKLPEVRRKEILTMRLPNFRQTNVPFSAVISRFRQTILRYNATTWKSAVSIEIRDPSQVLQQVRITTQGNGQMESLENILKSYCAQANASYQIDNMSIVISPKLPAVATNPPPPYGSGVSQATPVAGPPAGALPIITSPAWTSKEGKTIKADFVGLDGEAVVVRKDGKEVTIAFTKLSKESVAQAKRMYLPKSDILLHYDFSDGSGTTVKDRSGNGRDGTLIGFADTATGAGDTVRTSGWAKSGSLNFDGKDDQVTTPLTVAALSGGSFTLEAVVTHNDIQGYWSPLICSDVKTGDSPGLVHFGKVWNGFRTSPGSALQFRATDIGRFGCDGSRPTALGDGSFHHVAVVYDMSAAVMTLYFDHQIHAVKNTSKGTLLGDPKLLIGAVGWDARQRWFGSITEIRIAKRALTPAQFLPKPNPPDPVPPKPIHRYSFTGDAKDLIGTAHGKVVDAGNPTARFANGQLDLSANQGQQSTAITEDAYVDLPNGIVSKLNGKMTFEVWCTPTGWRFWENVFCFGRTSKAEDISTQDRADPYEMLGLTSRSASSHVATFMNRGRVDLPNNSKLEVKPGSEHHYAVVIDTGNTIASPHGTQSLYMDGYFLGVAPLIQDLFAAFDDVNNWLGRSQSAAPLFAGFYNEFRIYDKALTAREVLSSYLAGPDVAYGPGRLNASVIKPGASQ